MPKRAQRRTPSEEAAHREMLRVRRNERERMYRAGRTEEQREADNALARERQAIRRSNEGAEEAANRRNNERVRGNTRRSTEAGRTQHVEGERIRRSNETDEQAENRRTAGREREATRRSNETADEGNVRRQENAERGARRRAIRTALEREAYNEQESQLRRQSRTDDEFRRAERVRDRMARAGSRRQDQWLCAGRRPINDNAEPHYGGRMDQICMHCNAKHFVCEKVANKGMSFSGCCQHNTIRINVPEYPSELKEMFGLATFREKIRPLNNSLSFASFNANVVSFGIGRPGPYSFVVQGQVYYQINERVDSYRLNVDEGVGNDDTVSDEPTPRSYAQLYIVDPEEAATSRLSTFANMDEDATRRFSRVLSRINVQAQSFQMMHEQCRRELELAERNGTTPPNLSMHFGMKPGHDPRRYNLQASNEVAAVFATRDDGEIPDSYVTVYNKEGTKLKTVNSLNPYVEPWLYPVFFPHGKPVFDLDLTKVGNPNKRITRAAYAKYMISIRGDIADAQFNVILNGGRLFQQWLVDTGLKIIKERVEFLKHNQETICRDSYANIDAHMRRFQTENNARALGTKIILPSTHTGSPRYMEQNYQDAMSIVRRFGKPDLFITMTCNPKWKEITENLLEGQTASDRPDLVARVFKMKKDHLINIIKNGYFGGCKAWVYTIEFQKRGLPHCHLLVTLQNDYKMRTAAVVDSYISAQLPNPDTHPRLHKMVVEHMTHGPCGVRCMNDEGECGKKFPKDFQEGTTLDEDGYPTYARPNNGRTGTRGVNGYVMDNRYVVPHSPNLLLEFDCHINVEVVSSIKAVKYLYKYIFKGHDSAAFSIVDGVVNYDECGSFLNSRYMGAAEAVWRILGYPLHDKSHSIMRLPVHIAGQQSLTIGESSTAEELRAVMDSVTMLMDYFALNDRDPEARDLFYHQIPEHYVWKKVGRQGFKWSKRLSSFNVIGRMYNVSPSNPEAFHLRILLNHVKGARSYDELKTVEGTVCQTFTQACLELGLVEDDKEWERVMNEANVSLLPYQMRALFVRLLINCQVLAPETLWETFKVAMAEDFNREMNNEGAAVNRAYREICRLLEREERSISDFPTMPQEVGFDEDYDAYDPVHDRQIGNDMYGLLNTEQRIVADKVLAGALTPEAGLQKLFYIDGPGGSGKTYLYKCLWHKLRAEGLKVQTMAFTGIAAILLPEGKTNHKTLGLPVPLYADSSSSLKPSQRQGQEVMATDVFIMDEAPMSPRYALEVMDRLLRFLMQNEEPFGGKIVLLGGDFRQLLPVRKNGTRFECCDLSIKNSMLWNEFEKLSLVRNMRADADEAEFAEFLLTIGDGSINDEHGEMEFPEGYECETSLVQEVYTPLIEAGLFNDVANSAILSARNADVDELNKEVVELLPVAGERLYSSIDTAIESGALAELITQEYLNSLNPTSLPPHELLLRKNTVVMVIRNLSSGEGLCNGTRLLVVGLNNHTLQCRILTGDKSGNTVFIHRIGINDKDSYPFTLCRKQFPVKIAFAMTINKSQGQTFEKVGLDLRKDVFNHGQMYVGASRVKRASALKVHYGAQRMTKKVKNYVYPEIIG